MAEHEDSFAPDSVDEQVERPRETLAPEDARLVDALQGHYRFYAEENAHSLELAWERISAARQQAPAQERQSERILSIEEIRQRNRNSRERNSLMNDTQSSSRGRGRLLRLFGTIAAAAVILALIGSLAVFAALRSPQSTTTSQVNTTSTTSTAATVTVTPDKPDVPGVYVLIQGKDFSTLQIAKLDVHTHAMLWHHDLVSTGFSGTPLTVKGDTVYTVAIGPNDNYLYAFDARNGTPRWHTALNKYTMAGVTGPNADLLSYTTPPAVKNGIVYVLSRSGRLLAFSADHGNHLWTYDAGTVAEVNGTMYECGQPAVANGLVYGACHNVAFAVNAQTGARLWSKQIAQDQIFNDPRVVAGSVYLTSYSISQHHAGQTQTGGVYAYDAQTGAQRWAHPVNNWVLSAPTIVDGIVYFGSYNNYVYALKADKGTQIWSYNTGGEVYDSPVVSNGVVYVTEDGNATPGHDSTVQPALFALNAKSGGLVWKDTIGGSVMAVAHGVVYMSIFPRELATLDTQSGSVTWSQKYGTDLIDKLGDHSGIAPTGVVVP